MSMIFSTTGFIPSPQSVMVPSLTPCLTHGIDMNFKSATPASWRSPWSHPSNWQCEAVKMTARSTGVLTTVPSGRWSGRGWCLSIST